MIIHKVNTLSAKSCFFTFDYEIHKITVHTITTSVLSSFKIIVLSNCFVYFQTMHTFVWGFWSILKKACHFPNSL